MKDNLKVFDLEETPASIAVFTNDEHNPRTECDWSWEIYIEGTMGQGIFIKEDAGQLKPSDFPSGNYHYEDIEEFYSAYYALQWIIAQKLKFSVHLYVSSELLALAATPEIFRKGVERTYSRPLKTIARKLEKLIQKLDVQITQYSYANRDILPIY